MPPFFEKGCKVRDKIVTHLNFPFICYYQLMSVIATGKDATLDILDSTAPISELTEETEEMILRAGNGRRTSTIPLSSETSVTSQAATGGLRDRDRDRDRDSPPAFRVMSLPPYLEQNMHTGITGCHETDLVGYLYLCEINTEGFEAMRKLRITARAYTWPEVDLCHGSVTGKFYVDGDSQPHYAESRLAFLNCCKKCEFQSVLTCSIYSTDRIKVKSFCLSSSHPLGLPSSGSHSDLLLLVTGTNRLAVQGDGMDRSEGGSISDIRVLDGHTLCTLAVLGDSVYSSSSSDLLTGQPLFTDINNISAARIEIQGSGDGQGCEIDTKLKFNFPAFSVTAACMVPPIAHSLSNSPGIALITEHSTISCSTLLSNKLFLWNPHLSKIGNNLRILSTVEDYDMSCQRSQAAALLSSLPATADEMEKLLPSLLADSNELPFNSLPINNLSKKNLIGSKARDPLLVTNGRGQHQHFIVADQNGHIWYATRAPQSNFPGPMYPPGFTLMQRVKSYIEREDELDNIDTIHTHQRSDKETLYISSEISSLAIDVGVSPYFSRCVDPIGNLPEEKKWGKAYAPYGNVPSLSDRLPLRLIGEVRAAHLEAKVKAISNRKLCIAREKAIQTATRKKNVQAPSRVSKFNRKRKRPKGLTRTRQQTRSRGDGDSVNGEDESLNGDGDGEEAEALMPLDTIGEGDIDLEIENENENEKTRNISQTLKPQVQDTDDSGADTDNDIEQADVKPELISATEPMTLTSSNPPHPSPPRTIFSCLSDALPVPRRITTGDFALRLQREKEVYSTSFFSITILIFPGPIFNFGPLLSFQLGIIIVSQSSDRTVVADRLIQFEVGDNRNPNESISVYCTLSYRIARSLPYWHVVRCSLHCNVRLCLSVVAPTTTLFDTV